MSLKVDIVKEARELEARSGRFARQAVDQLLIPADLRGRELLTIAGLDHVDQEVSRLQEQFDARQAIHKSTSALAVLNQDEVKELCMRYFLRMLPSRCYQGHIEPSVGGKLAEFLDDIKDPSPSHSASTRLFVVAPADSFRLDIAQPPSEFMLLYRTDNGLYAVIHRSHGNFTLVRRLLGFAMASYDHWWWSTSSLLLIGGSLITKLSSTQSEILAIITGVTTVVLFFSRLMGKSDYYNQGNTFSREAWNNPIIPKK